MTLSYANPGITNTSIQNATIQSSLKLPTTGGAAQSNLNYYEEFTLPVQYSGLWAAPIDSSILITRIGRLVNLYFLSATDVKITTTGPLIITGLIPARFLPNNALSKFCSNVQLINNNNALTVSNFSFAINTITGEITCPDTWSSAGAQTAGLPNISFSYST